MELSNDLDSKLAASQSSEFIDTELICAGVCSSEGE